MNEWITIADTNGDGTLDIHEIEALFVNEVNNPSHTHTQFLLLVKMKLPNCLYYVLNITNSFNNQVRKYYGDDFNDRREAHEDMARMREHVMSEVTHYYFINN